MRLIFTRHDAWNGIEGLFHKSVETENTACLKRDWSSEHSIKEDVPSSLTYYKNHPQTA